MPYNRGMNEITLALPYALPPPELAPDLVRAIDTPALSMLLSRNEKLRYTAADPASRTLPHEAWLARVLGLSAAVGGADNDAPFAAAVLHGCGLAAPAGHWFIVQPAHVQLARTHLLLADQRQLRLTEDESRALFELARPSFEDAGKTLVYGGPELWFVRADDWASMDTATPDAAMAQNLSDWVPEGPSSRDFRKLQNEIQMTWHEHPVNEAREARGLKPVNSLWLWAGAPAAAQSNAATLAVADGPAWMMALAAPALRAPTAAQLLANQAAGGTGGTGHTIMLPGLIPSAIAGDWSDWLAAVHRIEHEWCAPLLDALQSGRIGSVTLLLNHRNGTLCSTTSKAALRKFWRKPSLNNLLKQA
jgi:hypothetical protein